MLNRNKKKSRTLISLTDFHKRYADERIENLSRFVRNCITKEMKKDYGEIRQLEIVKSLLRTEEWDATTVLIKSGNLTPKILEYVEDVKNILQKACQTAIDIPQDVRKGKIIYHISPKSVIIDIMNIEIDEENKIALQMLVYSHYLIFVYKQLKSDVHRALIDAIDYILAMLFMDES